MKSKLYCKILAVGIIGLFIGVGIHPAFAVDTKQSMVNKASIEDCGCEEVSATNLIRVERLLNRVEVYSKLLLVLSRYNPALLEDYEVFSNRISTITEMNEELKTDTIFQDSSFICDILITILINVGEMMYKYFEKANEAFNANNFLLSFLYFSLVGMYFFIFTIIMGIGEILGCWQWP